MHVVIMVFLALIMANPVQGANDDFFGNIGLGQLGASTGAPGAPGTGAAGTNPANQNPAQGKISPLPGRIPIPPPAPPRESVNEINPEPSPSGAATANLKSLVFGAHLFTGAFARQGPTQFNPDYLVAIGDSIRLRLWGSATFDDVLLVDPQGNIFMPNVGPVKVLGVRNQDLQETIEKAVRRVFRANVFSYASLAEAQPVRIYVGGFVNRPGLFNGTSMDSVLHYLDQAGGIDLDRGSFLNLQVKRGPQIRTHMNLYDFMLDGRIPQVQLADGDVIFVSSRQKTVSVTGLAENAKRFEFAGAEMNGSDLVKLAKPFAQATHVRVTRNTGTIRNVEYYPLGEAGSLRLFNGDELAFTADKRPGTITVRVEGEHQSPQEYELKYGTRLGELVKLVQFTERSDVLNLQLFRVSTKVRQKLILHTSLQSLEATALTARSGTSDEAQLRMSEANLLLQWVDRAKDIEPSGQVTIAPVSNHEELLLENGDIVNVPVRDDLVLVGGEVLFPTTVAFQSGLSVGNYIDRAGGYTQNADVSRIIVAHRNGTFDDGESGLFRKTQVRPGDSILVLPRIDVKWRQIAKDLAQILFQTALMTGVVLRLF